MPRLAVREGNRPLLGLVLLVLLATHGAASTHAAVSTHRTAGTLAASLDLLRSAGRGTLPAAALRSPRFEDAFDAVLLAEASDVAAADTGDAAGAMLEVGEGEGGAGDWVSRRLASFRSLRQLPAAIAAAEAAEPASGGSGGGDGAVDTMDVVGAVLFGLFDGVTMGLGEMYREAIAEFKRDETCRAHSDDVAGSFAGLRDAPGAFFRGLLGTARGRDGMGRVDFVAHKLKHTLALSGELVRSVVTLTASCKPLQSMLMPIVFLVLIGIVVTLVLFLIPGFGAVLKLAGILLSLVFGVKHLAKVARSLAQAAGRCASAPSGGCAKSDKLVIIESFAQLAGLLVSIVILSGLSEALRTPNLAREFSRAALLLKLRLAFTPRWSRNLQKLTLALDAAKSGSPSAAAQARAQVNAITADASLADDAARVSQVPHQASTNGGRGAHAVRAADNVDGKAIVDDIVMDAGRGGRGGQPQSTTTTTTTTTTTRAQRTAAAGASTAAARNLRRATGKLADEVASLGKSTDDIAAIKARSCGGPGMMLLEVGDSVGNIGMCFVNLVQSKNQIDFSARKLLRIQDDIASGIINKNAVDVEAMRKALAFQTRMGVDPKVAAASVADDAVLSPLVRKALGIEKPNATVNDVVDLLTKGGIEPYKARRLARELDETVKAVQRADSGMESAKIAYVSEADPLAAAQAFGVVAK
jgi:hypothetical protein